VTERRAIEIEEVIPPSRQVIVRPGYDCIRSPCGKNGCGKDPGASHGVHCDEWVYVVRDDGCALSLLVFSGVWPATVPAMSLDSMRFPRGADISLHCPFSPEWDEDEKGRECEWVRGGRCWLHVTTGLGGMNFVNSFFVKEHSKEQQEPFWRAMEDQFKEWVEPVRRRLN
jgi:hypothetical protein